ncbi:MAG TPA: protein kinase, partial [Bacteroidota bacterium]|nr:protein kinase [Bacteroidota bacterium]
IGTTVSHYRILEKLGEGGMGVVYKAEDTKLDRPVALKFLPQHLRASEGDKARFMQEAKAAAALNHPNVCSVIDIQEHDGQIFIVMEYVDGRTLREHRAVSLSQSLDIGIQIAEGLAAAHEKGIVHRDIKPDNIMVRKDGIVQIMDFGLAKLQGVSRLTQDGSTAGTAGYMSPEQVQGIDADHRSDIFSLGVVLYELFTGRLPFRGAHETAMAYEIVNVEAPPMSAVKPGIDPELDRIVGQCLVKNPDERMQSTKQVAVDLKRCKRESGKHPQGRKGAEAAIPGGAAGEVSAAPAGMRGVAKRRSLAIGLGALALVAGLAAVWMFLLRHPGPISSMVVLPFENVGANPDLEYLSDGVTEGIINRISKIPRLRVIPRSASFRFKGSTKDPGTIAKELGVDAVLSGRVVQRGNQLDLTLELVDVREFSQLWGEHYRRTMDDLITVQDEIVGEVRSKIDPGAAASASGTERVLTGNPAAYRLYLQGKYYWNKRTAADLERALEYFHQAIALDRNFALAHLGIAETYVLQGQYADKHYESILKLATDEAMRSLELDNTLGQAHAVLGLIAEYSWQWEDAERELKLAIEKAPAYATAYHWYFIFLGEMGKEDQGFEVIKKGAELDPYSPVILTNLSQAYLHKGDYGSASAAVQKALDIDPQFFFGNVFRASILKDQGKTREALEVLNRMTLAGLSSNMLGYVGNGYAALGDQPRARAILQGLLRGNGSAVPEPVSIAMVYAGLGDADSTIFWLRKARDQKSILLPNTRPWREFSLIHQDPRYLEILRSMGLGISEIQKPEWHPLITLSPGNRLR